MRRGDQQFGIEKIIAHSEFQRSRHRISNDIALIRLDRSIQFGRKLKPICLPFGTNIVLEPPVHSVLTTTGWDLQKELVTKRAASVARWDTDRCNEVYRVDETHICARGPGYSCRGDAGSPLIYKFDQRMVLEGIVSSGAMDCANTKYPSVYTRVRHYGDWLSQNMEM